MPAHLHSGNSIFFTFCCISVGFLFLVVTYIYIYIMGFFRGAVESIRCLDEIYKQKKSLRDVFNQEAVGLRNRSAVMMPHED